MQPDKMHVLALCKVTQILYDYNYFVYKHRAFYDSYKQNTLNYFDT